MTISFSGVTKIATLSLGTTELDVMDLYSRWKYWVFAGNAQYLPMIRPLGGDPIDEVAGTLVPMYAFLQNGWRIRPQEANHTLNVVGGILLVEGGGDPFLNTEGNYVVRINYQQPVQAIKLETDVSGLTTQESAALELIRKLLQNKQITDPSTGLMTVYDDDDSTVLVSGNVYEDVAAGQPYRGQGIDRRERLATSS